ncbi:MAG: LCP family protein [Actinomycetota bacterium]
MSVAARVLIVALGALAIVLGLGAIAIVRSGAEPQPEPAPAPAPVERTLLLQVLDHDGYALGNVVIGIEPPGEPQTSTFLEVPSSLLVAVGDDSVTLGETPGNTDTLAAVDGLQAALRLRIDAGLTLDRLAFAGLVDAVDGIWVKLPEPIVIAGEEPGEIRRIPAGWIKMDGVTAAEYAILRVPGESDADRMARFTRVLDLVLAQLPVGDERIQQLLTSLGSLAPSTVPTQDLVPFFLEMSSDVRFERTAYAVLPVDVIRVGIRPASVPAPGADILLDQLFPDARAPVGM